MAVREPRPTNLLELLALFVIPYSSVTQLFGTDGIRGIANHEPLTAPSVIRLAQAAATVLSLGQNRSGQKVILGRDTRVSGDFLEAALASGLASAGLDVLLAGTIPTPAIAYLTAYHQAAFGVVLSASHNPFQDNGIKFFGPDGYKLDDALEGAIEQRFLSSQSSSLESVGRIRPLKEAVEQYVDFVLSTVPKDSSFKGSKIVLDAANGAAYQTTPLALEHLGITIEVHSAEPNGTNINEACGSTHPEVLRDLVLKSGANVGLAHDGDADRILLADETGATLDGDDILAIAAKSLVSRGNLRSKTVVATVMSNFGLDALLNEMGATLLRSNVGDRHVVEMMRQHDLNLGGEQSGHIIFRDFTTTGDGLISALQVLAIAAETNQPLSKLREILTKFPQELRNIPVHKKLPFEQFPSLQTRLKEAEAVLAGKGRVVLRYSGTEPKARLLLEGPDADRLRTLADDIQAELEAALA
ncbi:MAG: phosphoglucosamine mutase [Verrucomicrobia bacterium]|nr:phosphoglucosamine mutase [Verrucomicrobiota bacterium]